MKKKLFFYIILFISLNVSAQQNSIFLHSFFKDQLFQPRDHAHYLGSSFLPVHESEYNLDAHIRDSSKQYYELTEILFKKHLLEASGKNYYLTISPIADLNIGKDFKDTLDRRIFQNTRGLIVEGDIYQKFSFSTAFYENQARFTQYETNYYSSIGELYPNQSNGTYTVQNAVIPGSARTKPFKVDGFDYGFAYGNLIYKPHPAILLTAGNSSQFIGDGHRSILLSDNSVPTPFFRGTFRISDKLEFNYSRMRLINLIRKPVSTTVEAYYETKAYSVNYLTFKPTDRMSISLFEGIMWSKGDSIISKRVHPLFYNPLPLIAEFTVDKQSLNNVLGINLSSLPFKNTRFYGQFAIGDLNVRKLAYQLGFRGYNYFGMKEFMIQLEFNAASSSMYLSENQRLNYSGYNLPLAHVKGNGFKELILRANYSHKRVYADLKSIFYSLNDFRSTAILPVKTNELEHNGSIFFQEIEIGYRFNTKVNLTTFASWKVRSVSFNTDQKLSLFSIGLRTGIINHYNDF